VRGRLQFHEAINLHMSNILINRQNDAERDEFLLACFFDTGTIKALVNSSYSILTGRKGTGKTAVALYLEEKFQHYNLDFANRITIRNYSNTSTTTNKEKQDLILQFIVIKLVQKMLKLRIFDKDGEEYWKDFLLQNGLQSVSDYETFVENQRTSKKGLSFKGSISNLFAKGEASGTASNEKIGQRSIISSAPSSLFTSLRETLPKNKKIISFIDDITDYLDESDKDHIRDEISIIKNVLLSLEAYNLDFKSEGLDFRFISLVRQDIFDFMEGSNINKLRSDSLELTWDEKSFASLLIKRMPFFDDIREKALKNPADELKKEFPDEIFSEALEKFNTNRYGNNFYAYMVAISFNRPRDFLQFAYALRDRLSKKNPATFENIESAEIEYSDYFIGELRDELYIASKFYNYGLSKDRVHQLVDILSHQNGFNPSQLKTELGIYLGEKTSIGKKKIEILIMELWRYGILGYSEKTPNKTDRIINFKYLDSSARLNPDKLKDLVFYLHRGLWWFARKRKSN
jgi:hypothetical protein